MTGCPTCGGNGKRLVRVRKGRARVKPPRRPSIYLPPRFRANNPDSSVRVYWPIRVLARHGKRMECPDPWHQQQLRPVFKGAPDYKWPSAPAETFTLTNLHDPKAVSRRAKSKARRHKAAQAKGRR